MRASAVKPKAGLAWAISLACLTLSAVTSVAATPKSHYYTVEVGRVIPMSKGTGPDVSALNVVFYGRKPTGQFAEAVLRSEMETFVRLYRPKHNVLGNAWVSPDGSELNEEKLDLPSGPSALLYESKTGKIRGYDIFKELRKSGMK